ncbi:hypothetical protein DFH09DRAFT_1087038 [Mycena vulgaris]|nr:hypothetical protein DFH09DRAFT_1087038 [Mycena vulgaris]
MVRRVGKDIWRVPGTWNATREAHGGLHTFTSLMWSSEYIGTYCSHVALLVGLRKKASEFLHVVGAQQGVYSRVDALKAGPPLQEDGPRTRDKPTKPMREKNILGVAAQVRSHITSTLRLVDLERGASKIMQSRVPLGTLFERGIQQGQRSSTSQIC